MSAREQIEASSQAIGGLGGIRVDLPPAPPPLDLGADVERLAGGADVEQLVDDDVPPETGELAIRELPPVEQQSAWPAAAEISLPTPSATEPRWPETEARPAQPDAVEPSGADAAIAEAVASLSALVAVQLQTLRQEVSDAFADVHGELRELRTLAGYTDAEQIAQAFARVNAQLSALASRVGRAVGQDFSQL